MTNKACGGSIIVRCANNSRRPGNAITTAGPPLRLDRYNRRTALLAEVLANELRLAEVEKELLWQQAQKAAWEVQLEEITRGNPATAHHRGGNQ